MDSFFLLLNLFKRGFDDYKMLRDQGEYFNPVFKSPDSNGQYIREEGYATDLIDQFYQKLDATRAKIGVTEF